MKKNNIRAKAKNNDLDHYRVELGLYTLLRFSRDVRWTTFNYKEACWRWLMTRVDGKRQPVCEFIRTTHTATRKLHLN